MLSFMRIMYVCLGNICRSPLAEAVCRSLLSEYGLEGSVSVESSGTCAYHVGEPADPRMRSAAARKGIHITHVSRQFAKDYASYDMIIAMDEENRRYLMQHAPDEASRAKVHLLRDFDPLGPGDLEDPYYGGPEGFNDAVTVTLRSCRGLLEVVRERLHGGK